MALDFTLPRTGELFDLDRTAARPLLEQAAYPWEVLPRIGAFLLALGETLDPHEYERREENVWVHKTARIFPNSFLAGPCVIGPETEVRPGAFLRGNALVGAGCVVGNSTELKNAILMDGAQVPHYNYVGDSVLGWKAHMGAGAVTSNVKQDKTLVTVAAGGLRVETGLKKFGAILGDGVEVGCHAVLNPGTVVGKGSRIYPLSMARGLVPAGAILKRGEIVELRGSGA